MKKEIEAAVNWWAEQLNGTKQDNGDFIHNAFMSMIKYEPAMPHQIAQFKANLSKAIEHRIKDQYKDIFQGLTNWYPSDPIRGSAFRNICVDYGADQILMDAAEKAGIHGERFPVKTSMWIDPGSVRVGHGYRAPVVEIYKGDPNDD